MKFRVSRHLCPLGLTYLRKFTSQIDIECMIASNQPWRFNLSIGQREASGDEPQGIP